MPEPSTRDAPSSTLDIAAIRTQILQDLDTRFPEDTVERQSALVQTVFAVFYDDDYDSARPSHDYPTDLIPGQPIRDCLTDLMHAAAARGVDFELALASASQMWTQEREEWGIDHV